MFTQLLELQIPLFLVRLFLGEIERETNLVKLRFSFRIHFAISEQCTLSNDPSAQLWVFLVFIWHIA
jgi:hypothetical protein